MGEEVRGRQAARRLAFTKAAIERLPVPAAGREYTYDSKTPGLALCVSQAGSKTFFLYKWVQGRPQRIRLGKFPDLSVENARGLARAIVGEIASGKDPMAERRKAREVPTIREAFQVWLDSYAKVHRKSWPDDERQFSMYLRLFHGRRLNTIRTAEVGLWHNELGQRHGLYQANRCFELLRTIYNQARRLLGYVGARPCEGVRKFKETARDRFLQPDEMPRFFEALAEQPEVYRDFFLLALLTGARRGNVQGMRWEDVNLGTCLWRIPGEEAKSGMVVVVPLVVAAVGILRRRLETSRGSVWVFPAERSKTGHMIDPNAHWRRLLKRAGIANLRVHDLRRSLGSWQAISGSSLPVIGRSLGHTSIQSTAIYARLTVDPVRASVEKATQAMLEYANGKPGTEVQGDGQDSEAAD